MNVNYLNPVPDSIPPNEKLVEQLEYVLKEAREGRLRSFLGAGIYYQGDAYRFGVLDKKITFKDLLLMTGSLHSLILTLDREYGLSEQLTTT